MKTKLLFSLGDEDHSQKFYEHENRAYLDKQVIMYHGRKKSLLSFIETEVISIKQKLGKNKISVLDGFSGSGIVARLFKKHSNKIYANDLEYYSKVINQCYLTNKEDINHSELSEIVSQLNRLRFKEQESSFIEELYSPAKTHSIKTGERAFFTNENAKIIDNIRRGIDLLADPKYHSLLIAPLLASLKDKANVQSVFRAFYKDARTNKGQWGGNNPKLKGPLFKDIILEVPVLSDFSCESEIYCQNINQLVRELPEVDVAYFDPPFDGYPYGENYFMYNLIAKYERPAAITREAGVPLDWNRSDYNYKSKALNAIQDLMENTKARFILFSYREMGLLTGDELVEIFENFGDVEVKSIIGRNIEHLFTIKKS